MSEATLQPLLQELARLLAQELAQLRAEFEVQSLAPEARRSPWLSAEAAAAYLDWPRRRLYRLCQAGEIPHYKQQGRLLFRREELDEWLQGFAQGRRA